jgi:hypothetical protein
MQEEVSSVNARLMEPFCLMKTGKLYGDGDKLRYGGDK